MRRLRKDHKVMFVLAIIMLIVAVTLTIYGITVRGWFKGKPEKSIKYMGYNIPASNHTGSIPSQIQTVSIAPYSQV